MKTLIMSFAIAMSLLVGGTVATNAGLWTSLTGAFADTVESKMFAIEAQGTNFRGYVFENPALKGRICMQTASEGGNGGLSCDWGDGATLKTSQ